MTRLGGDCDDLRGKPFWEKNFIVRTVDPIRRGLRPAQIFYLTCGSDGQVRTVDPIRRGLRQEVRLT